MFKKFIFLILALPFTVSHSCAMWEEFSIHDGEGVSKTLTAVWRNDQGRVRLTSVGPESSASYSKVLHGLPIKPGYPSPERAATTFKLQNIDRQTAGNLFHLFKVSFHENGQEFPTRLGFVQLGRMNSKGYAEGIEGNLTAHHPIIEKWISLGITRKVDPLGGLEDSNIGRIDNRGMAMILPLFKNNAPQTEAFRVAAIEACYNLVCELTRRQALLPLEGTLPHAAMCLFHPTDQNVGRFVENGFDVDEDEGFGWFYPALVTSIKKEKLEKRLTFWKNALKEAKESKGKKRTVRSKKMHADNMITSIQSEIAALNKYEKRLVKEGRMAENRIPQPRVMVTHLIEAEE